jgi:hypothetical protein
LERLARIVGKIEDRDFDGARGSLRLWDQDLDFNGIPPGVRHATDLILNTALNYLKLILPQGHSAIRSVEQAAGLWP